MSQSQQIQSQRIINDSNRTPLAAAALSSLTTTTGSGDGIHFLPPSDDSDVTAWIVVGVVVGTIIAVFVLVLVVRQLLSMFRHRDYDTITNSSSTNRRMLENLHYNNGRIHINLNMDDSSTHSTAVAGMQRQPRAVIVKTTAKTKSKPSTSSRKEAKARKKKKTKNKQKKRRSKSREDRQGSSSARSSVMFIESDDGDDTRAHNNEHVGVHVARARPVVNIISDSESKMKHDEDDFEDDNENDNNNHVQSGMRVASTTSQTTSIGFTISDHSDIDIE